MFTYSSDVPGIMVSHSKPLDCLQLYSNKQLILNIIDTHFEWAPQLQYIGVQLNGIHYKVTSVRLFLEDVEYVVPFRLLFSSVSTSNVASNKVCTMAVVVLVSSA